MAAPRLEINLDKIYRNTCKLVVRLAKNGISVTAVTKSMLGSTEIANIFTQANVTGLGDSRVENIKALRLSINASLIKGVPLILLRSPMLSQAEEVVMYADISCNSEIEVIRKLSQEAQKQGRIHGVLLMVELGDLREGIMPDELLHMVKELLALPHISLEGLGTNLACRSGVSPDMVNMQYLSNLAEIVESSFNIKLDMVSGGNSANFKWLFDSKNNCGRINNLRLGESMLLGLETLQRQAIDGLYTDAITLVAEVIESKVKPSIPSGDIAEAAFGMVQPGIERGLIKQSILAIGIQDTDPSGLTAPVGIEIRGASSDHLIVEADNDELLVGDEVAFQVNYSALLRSMTSPFVSKKYLPRKNFP